MSAGLPGLGLGGLFFIISALIAPFVEAVRLARGRSSRERRTQVARQFAIAATMVVAIDLTLRGVLLVGSLVGATSPPDSGLIAMPLQPIGITTGLLLLVVAGAKAVELATRLRSPAPRAGRGGRATVRPARGTSG